MKECYKNLAQSLAYRKGSLNISGCYCVPDTHNNPGINVISQMRKLRLRASSRETSAALTDSETSAFCYTMLLLCWRAWNALIKGHGKATE